MHLKPRRLRPLALLDTSHDLGRCAAELGDRVEVGQLLTPPDAVRGSRHRVRDRQRRVRRLRRGGV